MRDDLTPFEVADFWLKMFDDQESWAKVIDDFSARYIADDYVHLDLPYRIPAKVHGKQGFKDRYGPKAYAGLSNISSTYGPNDIFESKKGNETTISLYYLFEAVHTGYYLGVPSTQKHLQATGALFIHFRDGIIVMSRMVVDTFSLLLQLGKAALGQDNKSIITEYIGSLRNLGLLPAGDYS